MQFRCPTENRGSVPHSPGSSVHRSGYRPSWLKDWIADKGRWVRLVCGHTADLNDNGQMNLEGEKKGDILTVCEKCQQFCAVERHITYFEYRGIPTAVIPDEPLF